MADNKADSKAGNPSMRRRPKAWHAAAALLVCVGVVTTVALVAGSGHPAAPYDFNGDGKPDLTIGLPGKTVGGDARAGSVIIANGTATGPASTAVRIDQASPGVPGEPEVDDHFGQSVASCDFDSDGYADLAVSAPLEAIGTTEGAGMLTVHYGGSGGIYNGTTESFDEDTTNYPGAVGKDDVFTYSLAAGDVNGDGYCDLAVGQPLDSAGGQPNAGTIKLMLGTSTGLNAADTIQIDQNTNKVPGAPEAEDRFGEQLAVADVNGDGIGDLISATLGEQISGSSDRGSLHILYGPIGSAPASGGYIDSGNVTGIGEFAGSALAVGHFNADDYADVAVGVSDEEVGTKGAAGRLAVFYGGSQGLSATSRVKLFDQESPGISGASESEDYFASSLAAGDFDGNGTDDLVVGMRSEAIGSATGSGASMILFGNATGGITTKGALWIDQDTDGVPGTVGEADHFGWTVGALDTDGNGRVEPLVGAPGNAAGTITLLKVKPGTLESAKALAEADLGLPAGSDGDAFGIALAH
ncbi:FG-GAP and VCBS repeat-containing protein [Streptomyces antibioticus]|uniref:FG-GAP and VCBS repeat-containing protein n=1 Tax=Streptomyces antibioticus TaxID=1890 RepID=UPI0022560CE5|nr:FG-GAP and VCBS repeat-containing protein [Streptomyces antibioticus]MCX4743792.1 FG-GAP repeat protein [Streptomyces antibioticus]